MKARLDWAGIAIGAVFLHSGSAQAMTPEQYQVSTAKLRQSEARTHQMVQRMMMEAGLATPEKVAPAPDGDQDGRPQPLMQIHGSLTELRIPIGKILYGRTLNRLVVGSEPSPIIVVVSPDQDEFSGLRLLGVARQSATPGRVSLGLTQLLLQNGKSIPIQGQGLDEWGALGLEAQVFSSKALAAVGSLASGFISGLAATEQDQVTNAFGLSQVQPTGRDAILGGLAESAADASKQLLQEETQEQPVLTVEPDAAVSILIEQEVRY